MIRKRKVIQTHKKQKERKEYHWWASNDILRHFFDSILYHFIYLLHIFLSLVTYRLSFELYKVLNENSYGKKKGLWMCQQFRFGQYPAEERVSGEKKTRKIWKIVNQAEVINQSRKNNEDDFGTKIYALCALTTTYRNEWCHSLRTIMP